MTAISVIMPCYNASKFLAKSIESVIAQRFKDWELIIVNDGSTDNSLEVATYYAGIDSRIRVDSKENGGYVSARLHGLQHISASSQFLLFFDADDMLHTEMLAKAYESINTDHQAGAVYCNHKLIDINGDALGDPQYGIRIVPTMFWMKELEENVLYTPFISIFCWATRMIEPMTLIRREAYEKSSGWDVRFGKGKGNIGDGVLLFSEIALTWKVIYVNEPLYYYRKHPEQMTSSSLLNQKAAEKVLMICNEKFKDQKAFSRDIKAATICYKYRLFAYTKLGSVKHLLRFKPLKGLGLLLVITGNYILSIRLLFYRNTKVFQY